MLVRGAAHMASLVFLSHTFLVVASADLRRAPVLAFFFLERAGGGAGALAGRGAILLLFEVVSERRFVIQV